MKSKLAKAKDNPSSTYWQRKALAAWHELIAFPGRCAVCGKARCKLDCHHLTDKADKAAKAKVMNGILLCAQCHKLSTSFSAHQTPIPFAAWLQRNRPEQYQAMLEHEYHPGPVDWKADHEHLRRLLGAASIFTGRHG